MAGTKYNVRTQYAAWVGAVTLAAVVALTVVHLLLEISFQRAVTRDRAQIAARTLAKMCVPELRNPTATNQWDRVFATALIDEQVFYARVFNATGQEVGAVNPRLGTSDLWLAREPAVWIGRRGGVTETNQLGVVEIGLAPVRMQTALWKMMVWDLVVGLVMVAVAVAASFLASTPVQRGLRDLLGLVNSVATGESRGAVLASDLAEVEEVSEVLTAVVARVEEAQGELARAQREMKSAQREMDEYTYVISHDLKEPLRGIEAFSGFLVERYRDKLDDQGRHWLEVIRNSTVRMKRLIDDLLKFSRMGQQKKPMELIGLNSMLMHVRVNLQYRLDEKKADLRVEKLPLVVCEPTAMTEVFHNLISNGLKYNDKPHPVIEVGCGETTNPHTGGAEYLFHVRDNGMGIKPEHFDKVFQLFQRLQKDDEGTGIGLTIVKRVIEWHGGRIWLESEYGKGTTFYFTLPQREVTPNGTVVDLVTEPPKGEPEVAADI
jgi:signal transduction histidine kinase